MGIGNPQPHQRYNRKEMLLFGRLSSVRPQLLPNSKLNWTVGGYVSDTKGHRHRSQWTPLLFKSSFKELRTNYSRLSVIFASFLWHVLAIELQLTAQCRLTTAGLQYAMHCQGPAATPYADISSYLRILLKANGEKGGEKVGEAEGRASKCKSVRSFCFANQN